MNKKTLRFMGGIRGLDLVIRHKLLTTASYIPSMYYPALDDAQSSALLAAYNAITDAQYKWVNAPMLVHPSGIQLDATYWQYGATQAELEAMLAAACAAKKGLFAALCSKIGDLRTLSVSMGALDDDGILSGVPI